MSGSLTQLYLSNPALATAIRRRQAGEQFTQQGMDTSPTSWAGALARLAQAYVGTRDVNRADAEIKTLGDAQTARDDGLMSAARGLLGGGQQPIGTPPAPVPLPQAPGSSSEALPPIGTSPASAPPELMAHYEAASRETGIPVAVLVAKDKQESGFNNGLRGKAGEYGIAQILPSTAAQPGYGIPPATPEELADPGKNILFGARILKAFGTRSGVTDWNDPAQVSAAYKAYNGGGDPNYVANVSRYLPAGYGSRGVQVASNTTPGTATDAGAPAPGASSSPGQSPLVGAYLPPQAPQQQAAPASGASAAQPGGDPLKNARQFQSLGLQMMNSGNPRLQAQGQQLMQMGTQMLTVGKFENFAGPGGVQMQRNSVTGEVKPVNPGTGRSFTDTDGNSWIVPPGGGQPYKAVGNASGITGTSDIANAARAINTIAPKIQGGTATPQEIQNYNTALTLFQGHKTVTDPSNNKITQVPERPLPPGTPEPPAGAHTGAVPLTEGGFGAKTAAGIQESQGKDDAKNIAEEQAKIATGHGTLATTQTIRSTLPQVTTGVAAEQRLRAQQIFTALGVPDATAKEWTGTSAPMGEILQKKLFELSTGAVRGMGAREPGSVVAMFAKNYPNMTSQNMTIDAMTRLLDMDQTYKEAEIGARGGHLNSSVARLSSGQPYQGMAGYAAPDPRPFQAAALAAGGMPFDVWSRGLTPEQQTAALKLAGHVWPDASALDAKGVRHTFQPPRPQ